MSLRQGQSIRKTDMNVKMSIYLLGWKRIKKIKKLLTKPIIYDNINEMSLRQQQRTLKTEQYVKP